MTTTNATNIRDFFERTTNNARLNNSNKRNSCKRLY